MESRFARLRERDRSVEMLRVKMSRRRSQVQKENRERVVNTRRHLGSVKELEISALDVSVAQGRAAQGKERGAKESAQQERMKQLQRWKDRKALEKEKEKREKTRKGVFKTGLYHPKGSLTPEPLPPVAAAAGGRSKELKTKMNPAPSSRVTRSMKQMPLQETNTAQKNIQPLAERTRNRGAAPKPAPAQSKERATRALSTRSTNRPPVPAAAPLKDKCVGKTVTLPVQEEDISKSEIKQNELPKELTVKDTTQTEEVPKSSPRLESFAPEGFLFQAPLGVPSFQFDPMTPRSADAFLTPSSSFTLPPPSFDDETKAEGSEPCPPKSPRRSPPPSTPEQPKHDVPYFRGEISNETERLTDLCSRWEPRIEDESIPEEMRDRMRTAVGQARLLMKERFNQFSGLVDDCEFGRGEKVTTCTDLQGFWDMVYFQVEDVNKKFDALKEAEGRDWVEEHKPPPRQRKVVKKPAPVPPKPAGTKAAAKSRLAAAKAAMKARQAAESEKETEQSTEGAQPEDGQSSAKTSDSVRRSSRLSALVPPLASPSVQSLTPRRVTRRSLALAQTPVQSSANPGSTTPCLFRPGNKTPAAQVAPSPSTPQPLSPLNEKSSDATEQIEDCVSEPVQLLPTVTKEQDKPSEELSQSKSPEKSASTLPSLSFSLSQCEDKPCVLQAAAVENLQDSPSVSATTDNSVHEDMPVVDFERYLQPSQRDTLSPRRPFALESPVTTDVDMESPPETPVTQQETVSSTLVSRAPFPSPQTAEADMLLFTPDLKDRIRQSRCPRDLMVFTPPL